MNELSNLIRSPEMLAVLSLVAVTVLYKLLQAHIDMKVSKVFGKLLFKFSVYDRGMTIQHDTSTGSIRAKIIDIDDGNVWLDYGESSLGGIVMKPIPLAGIQAEMLKWSVVNYSPEDSEKKSNVVNGVG